MTFLTQMYMVIEGSDVRELIDVYIFSAPDGRKMLADLYLATGQ